MVVGVLHPGEMGAALGAALRAKGETVLWASTGRSPATAYRASTAGLTDVVTVEELARRSEVIVAVCPPHAALELARSMPPFAGVYVDANAVSPATARTIAGSVSAMSTAASSGRLARSNSDCSRSRAGELPKPGREHVRAAAGAAATRMLAAW